MLLEGRRASLTAQRVRSVNQIYALLRGLVAGGAPTALKAAGAAALLRKIRPTTTAQRAREQLARDLVREIRALDTALESITGRMIEALEARPTGLVDIGGVGPPGAHRPAHGSGSQPDMWWFCLRRPERCWPAVPPARKLEGKGASRSVRRL